MSQMFITEQVAYEKNVEYLRVRVTIKLCEDTEKSVAKTFHMENYLRENLLPLNVPMEKNPYVEKSLRQSARTVSCP